MGNKPHLVLMNRRDQVSLMPATQCSLARLPACFLLLSQSHSVPSIKLDYAQRGTETKAVTCRAGRVQVSAADQAVWTAHFRAEGQQVFWTSGKDGDGVRQVCIQGVPLLVITGGRGDGEEGGGRGQ